MNEDNNINSENKDPEKEFEVPKGYFESFDSRLMARIQLQDELKAYKMLASLEKKNCFEIPANYFETRDFVKASLELKEEATIVLFPRVPKKTVLSIAAALILVLGIATFLKVYNNDIKNNVDCTELACLTKEEITDSKYFEQISMDELESVANGAVIDSLGSTINEEALNEIMADPDAIEITDEDLGI